MKSILISIQPKYLVDILNGKKTLELRKSRPKCDLPIDVYLYCTSDGKSWCKSVDNHKRLSKYYVEHNNTTPFNKIVAKFTLNDGYKIDIIDIIDNLQDNEDYEYHIYDHRENAENGGYGGTMSVAELLDCACVSEDEVRDYLCNRECEVWVINDLEILEKPLELSQFTNYKEAKVAKFGKYNEDKIEIIVSGSTSYYDNDYTGSPNTISVMQEMPKPLTRPPQSWQYVDYVDIAIR